MAPNSEPDPLKAALDELRRARAYNAAAEAQVIQALKEVAAKAGVTL
jgi:hypothetical protein